MSDLKVLAMRFFDEVVNNGNLDIIDELVDEDFVDHEGLPGMPAGREGQRAMWTMSREAFPNMRFAVEDMLQEGDKVVARLTITGTHKGEFLGLPASNKDISVQAIDIFQYRDGKLVAHWGVTDFAGMMAQMGVTPAAG